MSDNVVMLEIPSNVVRFEQSLSYHAATQHVLGLALEKATARGIISAEESGALFAHARKNFDVGEMRHMIEIVLNDLREIMGAPEVVA